jgi:RsiW-degrading membrane proteinase PrsW (M82 family)
LLSELGIARVLIGAFGDREGTALTIGIGAPGIEECAKGLALFAPLWFLRRDVSSVAGGAIQGALIGLGFATSENVIFFALSRSDVGTVREMSEVFLIRSVLDVAGHAAYTATTGAILGWARSRRRFISLADAMLALGLAVLLHVLWNCGSLMLAQAVDSSASKNDSAALQTIVQCTLPNGSSYQLVGWCP